MFVSPKKKTAAPGDSLLAKAVLSVVKADSVQGGGTKSMYEREISILWLPMTLFGNQIVTFLLDCTFGKMILPRLKSSIPAGFFKLNRLWSLQ